jgi:PAS domain S-box-containing protein
LHKVDTLHILIIDSSEGEALIVGEMLQSIGDNLYEIYHVINLKEAIDFLDKNKIDVVLVNLFLEDSFGIHTFNNLFKRFPDTPFIILTDVDDDLIGRNAVKKGAQDYLTKALIDKTTLSRTIAYSLERKKTGEELRKSEEKYRELFMRSKDAIYISTTNGEFVDINPSGLSLFGYNLDDLQFLKVRDLYVNLEDRNELIYILERDGDVENYEIELIKKDKITKLHCLLATTVIYDQEGKAIGYQGIIKDVTAKKNAEEALFRSLRDLDQANKELNYLNATLEEKVQSRTKELKNKVLLIENQHKEITESINYAKRIQASILPSDDKIKKYLPDSFIYYSPKDIVSGDFYWFDHLKENPMLAIVDCTGHGVPGAFMSIIGYTQLNEIVSDHKLTDPGKILKELDKRVRLALNQNKGLEGNSKDGMELGLISIDYQKKQIKYAGAMRPLYYVRDGELSLLKGSKFAIGGNSLKSKVFETQTIKFRKDDCLYLFTDGYPDQFGGPKGKKFMTKNVGTMVTKISNLSMKEQGQIIKKSIKDWMRDEDQVDDILITGIKF